MAANQLARLPDIFQHLTDPRDPRGVRFTNLFLTGLSKSGVIAEHVARIGNVWRREGRSAAARWKELVRT